MQSATTPLYLEHERPFIDLDAAGSDGKMYRKRFLVDTGGGTILLREVFARELGIPLTGERLIQEWDMSLEQVAPPSLFVGNLQLELYTNAFIIRQKNIGKPENEAGEMISGRALASYRLTLDFPRQQLTLSQRGNAWASGEMLLSPVHPGTGFARVEITIGCEEFGMLLDTGAGCTMVSPRIFEQWSKEHPEWPRTCGAFGSANKGTYQIDAGAKMMRIPQFQLGLSQVEGICVVARPIGERFEQLSTQMLTGPAIGTLGGNVLKHFRYEIDYVTGISHLKQQSLTDLHDLDMVGLSLYPQGAGLWGILALADGHDARLHSKIRAGDTLLEVNEIPITGWPLASVIDALHGVPGQTYSLLLERDGERLRVKAPVIQVL